MRLVFEQIGAGLRALVVDDDEPTRDALDQILADMGFTVEVAATLQEARRHLARGHDIVLVDKNLPDGTGLVLAEEVAAQPDGPEAVLMTGDASLDSAVAAMRAQAADYLVKPFRLSDLEDRLRAIVEARARRRAGGLAAASGGGELDLGDILACRAFRAVYQPIVDARSWSVLGYEALTRPLDARFATPEQLIHAAERVERIPELGRALREVAVAALPDMAPQRLLFLNVHPHELACVADRALEPALHPWASRTVLELTESARVTDPRRARGRIEELRGQGFRIALDDLGAGYATLSNLALLSPDFVKLDMAMVRGIHEDSRSARLIRHILEFCADEGMRVIAEGIETADELAVVVGLGVPLLQGFYLARPEAPFADVRPRAEAGLPGLRVL